jgi:outer membrane protein assembly factor BamB
MKQFILIAQIVFVLTCYADAQTISQWRGPNRDGVFPESDLLKSWPEGGPQLRWIYDESGRGFSSVTVTENELFITGLEDTTEYLTALDFDGNRLWRLPYGLSGKTSYPDTRCTPTVEGNFIYLISGRGKVVCVNKAERRIQWEVPAFDKFRGRHWQWGIAESPLLVDDMVIYTPGGPLTTMVALDKSSGETVWKTESLNDTSAFVSPILIEIEGNKIIIGMTIKYIFGVDARSGKFLWEVPYVNIQPPTFHVWAPRNNTITPLYHEGHVFITSGYDHVGVMFRLLNEGSNVEQAWLNPTLDTHHGQVVRVGNYIYGSNWIDNRTGNWCCLDWSTGETMYEKEWHTKGPVIAADNMLYCYDERRGNVALVEARPDDFKITGTFRVTEGSGPYWSPPVIHKGVLYIRHGNVLMAYDIRDLN